MGLFLDTPLKRKPSLCRSATTLPFICLDELVLCICLWHRQDYASVSLLCDEWLAEWMREAASITIYITQPSVRHPEVVRQDGNLNGELGWNSYESAWERGTKHAQFQCFIICLMNALMQAPWLCTLVNAAHDWDSIGYNCAIQILQLHLIVIQKTYYGCGPRHRCVTSSDVVNKYKIHCFLCWLILSTKPIVCCYSQTWNS